MQVKELMARPITEKKSNIHQTVFREILDSNLPVCEKTFKRLVEDLGAVVTAGTITTAWAITVAVFYVVSQAETL